jgi:hypothetical protein
MQKIASSENGPRLERTTKAGRNDSCPCGSGKKYKKCCLATDQAASATAPSPSSPPPAAARPPRAEFVLKKPMQPAWSSAPALPTKAADPPPPPDPIAERAEQLWVEFGSRSDDEEGQIGVFLEALEDAEVMTDDTAFEMLECLRSDAIKRGERSRVDELVAAFRERLPEAYEKSAPYYLSWGLRDALAENRLETVALLTRELAARAGSDIDIFNRAVEALAYHGKLSVLVEAFRIGWPSVKSSTNIMSWGVSEFMNTGADYEIFDYLEHTSSPDPTDPGLLDHVKFFVEEPREEYLAEFVSDLTGKDGREWRTDDFALRRRRKTHRNDWDDHNEGPTARDPAASNLTRLINEFVGYARREEAVPFPRGHLVRNHLYSYFVERHNGKLDPCPSMFDQVLNPDKKLPKPPPPVHPLCPERVTLDGFLDGLMGIFNGVYQPAAAVFQAIPAWLRFLESRRLIDAALRLRVADELLPLHATLSELWQDYGDDPTLDSHGRAWPADAAKGPSMPLA